MDGLTFDTGALIALEANRSRILSVVKRARELGRPIVAPAAAVTEWWRGFTDRRRYILDRIVIVQNLDDQVAKLAGEALATLSTTKRRVDASLTIDATVIATAAIYGPNLYTGDLDDMQRFAGFFPDVRLFGLGAE